jgi:hypothetical protein
VDDEDKVMKPSRLRGRQAGRHPALKAALLIAGLLVASIAWAALPPPTPAQQQAAAEKKAKADAQAAKDKESLAASMDAVSARWRTRASQEGWKTHPAVAIAAAAPAPAPAAAGAAAGTSAAPVSASVTAAGPASAPAGTLGAGATTAAGQAAANPGVKSEKLGTAPPSEDVKKAPTKAQPRDARPTIDKGTPDVKNK